MTHRVRRVYGAAHRLKEGHARPEKMTDKIERILIAVKPWESCMPISVTRVVQMARSLNARVTLTSCVRLSAMESGFVWSEPATSKGLEAALQNDADEELEALERLAQPLRDEGVIVDTRAKSDRSASQGILDEVVRWGADLLVAGVHGAHSSLRPRVTAVDRQLMRLCPCPLLLTRALDDAPYRSILAAVDPLRGHMEPVGLDQAILRAAGHFRDALQAQLRIVSVHPEPGEFEIASSVEVKPGIFYGTENVEAVHRQALIDLAEACGVADAELVLRGGVPSARVAEFAADPAIDLIVLGSIKRGLLQSALLGSTAERVVDDGQCDVLLIRAPA